MNDSNYSLHLLFSIESYKKAKPLIKQQDRILLLQDGCYLVNSPALSSQTNLFVREKDISARATAVPEYAESIDDEQWVTLAAHAQNVLSWN